MILAIVRIALPPRTDRTAAARRAGGGVYLWPNRDTAARWHGTEYRDMIASIYGVEPEIEFVDVVLHVDPRAKRIDLAPPD